MLPRTLKNSHRLLGAAILLSLALPASLRTQTSLQLPAELQTYVRVRADRIVLGGVSLIDGTGAPPVAGQVVVIEHGRITAVGSPGDVRAPADAEVLDLAGHTVIPGLVGMHNHLFATGFNNLEQARMYLASGVTTIRTAGSFQPYQDLNLKREIDAGRLIGPRIHFTGPYVTGPAGSLAMARVSSPDAARRLVAYWAQEGATWIKVYADIRRSELRAVIDEAHKRGLRVTGHLCSITYREAAELGIDNIEHGLVAAPDFDPRKTPDTCPAGSVTRVMELDPPIDEFQPLIRALVGRRVALTSTLPVLESFVPGRPSADERVLSVMSPTARDSYRRAREQLNTSAGSQSTAFFGKEMALERAFVDAGGLLVAGVDPVVPGVLPGFADQRNYELLLEAGFAPAQAMQIMTANGARLLGELNRVGTIEVGKLADLVVLDGNLVRDPTTIRRPIIVFKGGIGFDATKLIASLKPPAPQTVATAITISPEILRRYVGEYDFNGRVFVITLEADRLHAQLRGQQKVELGAESEKHFFITEPARVRYEFDVTADGTVKGVMLRSGGGEVYAKKIK